MSELEIDAFLPSIENRAILWHWWGYFIEFLPLGWYFTSKLIGLWHFFKIVFFSFSSFFIFERNLICFLIKWTKISQQFDSFWNLSCWHCSFMFYMSEWNDRKVILWTIGFSQWIDWSPYKRSLSLKLILTVFLLLRFLNVTPDKCSAHLCVVTAFLSLDWLSPCFL